MRFVRVNPRRRRRRRTVYTVYTIPRYKPETNPLGYPHLAPRRRYTVLPALLVPPHDKPYTHILIYIYRLYSARRPVDVDAILSYLYYICAKLPCNPIADGALSTRRRRRPYRNPLIFPSCIYIYIRINTSRAAQRVVYVQYCEI